ncbi:MAG TPA: CCA tRNA nucleotidyltransferase [archaeon]|nr:CCA tRNA nucleotidyltransferase [archaeon]
MPKNYSAILKEVLHDIKPGAEERKRIHAMANKVLATTRKEAKRYRAKAIIAGSITRDTWLPGKMEFDVFVLFPEKLSGKKFEETGLKVGKSIFEKLKGQWRIEYAQHPYVSGNIEGIEVDIVPSYDVKSPEQLKSAVDRTPFHVKYLEKHLPLKLADEVRLLKQFLTANEIYGAEQKTGGFSGYVCELLIIKYRKFLNVLQNIIKLKPGDVIDIENYYKKGEHDKLRRQFKDQTLILIDPTDKTRNTWAAVSSENFFKFKKFAAEFLKNPSYEMFSPRIYSSITENELILKQMQRRTELIIVRFAPPKVVPDILWPQLRRFSERLQSILEETQYEFKVLRRSEYSNEKDMAVVLLEMEVSKLPSVQKRVGPKVFDIDDSERFLKKYKANALAGPFVEDSSWVVETQRKFMAAREKLMDSLKEDAKILKAKGIPNHIANEIAKGFEITSESNRIMELVKEDKGFGIFINRYFTPESLV